MPRPSATFSCILLTSAAALAACGGPPAEARGEAAAAATPRADTTVTADRRPLLPVAAESTVTDPNLLASIRRGRAILTATRDSLPDHVGNALRCTSCHLDEGRRSGAMPWVGVYARFPQYRSREDFVMRLEDRINGCLRRSMNGRVLPHEHPAMRDMVAYMAFLSRGVAVGGSVKGQGIPRFDPPSPPDTVRGRAVFAESCARCHGKSGGGGVGPPLWGPRSFNVGAGMARQRTAAGFIRHNMPDNRPGTLTDQEAADVAAWVVSRPRPDFAGKERDWPRGGAPPDVAYRTQSAGKRPPSGAPGGSR
jgi:thiosulfate dehydrogenase